MLKKILFIPILILFAFLFACNSSSKPKKTEQQKEQTEEDIPENNLTFRDVNGVRFFEVKRRFANGLSFNKDGFQHEPSWIIEHKAPDSMLAYSPEKQAMEHFYLQFDHERIYNFAREFFRVKVINKDSIVLQRLQVDGKIIAGNDDIRSDVVCTFYTKDYIEKTLKTTIGELQRPTKADTLFIKGLAQQTNKDPGNPKFAFAARNPVEFLPNSKNVSVEKISTIDKLEHRNASVDYMYPFYKMVISKSYKDFSFRFSVIVDSKGKLYVNRVEGVMADDVVHRKKLLDGITSVYLQNLFIIKPGTTLGIPHSSEITLNVKGIKSQ